MFRNIILIVLVILSGVYSVYAQKNTITLKGEVINEVTGEPVFSARIYFPDIKVGTSSGFYGEYEIEGLPPSKLLVRVTAIGYKDWSEVIDLSVVQEKNFLLSEMIVEEELDEIIITGVSKSTKRKQMPLPVSTLSAKHLKRESSSNIIDAITSVPGVSSVATGPGISKPVIRGLGFNRVVVVNDGVRQEGQQWGDEHGIEIDEYSVNHVEVLKGPASLIFGSDALAGVVNMLSAPSVPEGKIEGNILLNYQSNNGLFGGSANLKGKQKDFIWDVRYSHKEAHDYKNKYDGYVFNSKFKENALGGTIGLNKSWGFSHLHLSTYNFTPGIITGERDFETGSFVKEIGLNGESQEVMATRKDFKSYTPKVPYQRIQHHKAVLNNHFVLGNGSLKAIVGWQQNNRKEFENPLDNEEYELYFKMNTLNYDLRYSLPEVKRWNISVGINGMYQGSKNLGDEFLIPDYSLFDIGSFVLFTKSWDKFNLSGGLRYDLRHEIGTELWLDSEGNVLTAPSNDSYQQFEKFKNLYHALSGSVGMTYQINKSFYTKFNLAKGFRAPNIAEISANGVHEGTSNYIIGNLALKPEDSWQVDYAFGLNTEHVNGELTVFYSYISDYIFYHQLNSINGGDSLTQGYRTYKYTSEDAFLFGGEVSVDVHPHPIHWLHFENTLSYVQGQLLQSVSDMKYLPFIPAPKWTSDLRADLKKIGSFIKNAYVKVGIEHHFKQDKIFSAYNTESETPRYTLVNFGFGGDIVNKNKTLFSIYFNVNNLTDVAYQSHLSRLKYMDYNGATGRRGVYNMGRNFSLKIMIPIDIKQ